MFLFAENFPDSGMFCLSDEEAHHAFHVMRLKAGDSLFLLDGKGRKAGTVIRDINKNEGWLEIITAENPVSENDSILSLAICPTKNSDRNEWLIEKAVEAGVREIFFVESLRTERGKINHTRLSKIAKSALKQSGRLWIPVMHELKKFKDHLKDSPVDVTNWIAHCDEGEKFSLGEALKISGRHHVLIGPEGDFHPDEIMLAYKFGYKGLNLGAARLRTETAAILVSFAFSDCMR
jgi:16S rRNA (uracil1498-N3)-methyltransferase